MRKKIISLSIAVLIAMVVAMPATAHQDILPHAHAQERSEVAQQRAQGRLDQNRKRVCATRSERIKSVMQRAGAQGERHLSLFNKAVERAEQYVSANQIPVADYGTLQVAVATQKDQAQAAIDALKAGVNFDCDGSNPIGAIEDFKTKLRTMQTELKEYRSAIKDLLAAIKVAANDQRQDQEGSQ